MVTAAPLLVLLIVVPILCFRWEISLQTIGVEVQKNMMFL